jgi:hypothetical protein
MILGMIDMIFLFGQDQPPKSQIYNDLFFDADDAPVNINPQFFYARLNDRYKFQLFI